MAPLAAEYNRRRERRGGVAPRRWERWATGGALAFLAACRPAAPPASEPPRATSTDTAAASGRPTAAPSLSPVPSPSAAPPLSLLPSPSADTAAADGADVARAFVGETHATTDEALVLASATCSELQSELQTNPNELASLRADAANLHRLGRQEADLDTAAVAAALAELDQALAALQSVLGQCGITAP